MSHVNQDKQGEDEDDEWRNGLKLLVFPPIYIPVFSTWQLTVLALPSFRLSSSLASTISQTFNQMPESIGYIDSDAPMPPVDASYRVKSDPITFFFRAQLSVLAPGSVLGCWLVEKGCDCQEGGGVCVCVVNGRDKCRSFLLITRVICEGESGGWEGQRLTQS